MCCASSVIGMYEEEAEHKPVRKVDVAALDDDERDDEGI